MQYKLIYTLFVIVGVSACSSNNNQNNATKTDPEATKKLENMFISKDDLDLLAYPEKDPFYRDFGGEYDAVMQMGALRNLPAIVVINQFKECTFSYAAIYPTGPVETQREMGILKFKSASGDTEYYTFSNGDSKYDVTLTKKGDSRFIKISGYNWQLTGKLKNSSETPAEAGEPLIMDLPKPISEEDQIAEEEQIMDTLNND